EGAVLFSSTYWLPDFLEKATYEIKKSSLPSQWKIVSPLKQLTLPQQEIYLIAGDFQEYTQEPPLTSVPLKVYLRKPDPQLAQTFLSLLPNYLDHYQKTLGAFPYQSFAVIENFWDTGFGMPAFTLLGPNVIRLPYILNSSLPHELLHNWWGNSVYVDYSRGNWCEGLTTYLADHWQQEILHTDSDYRRQSLMNFQAYAKAATDFPLREFKDRFSLSSQAIGYGKGMMFFHMLKTYMGPSFFAQGLRNLYQNYRAQSISYQEIETNFETVFHKSLKIFFEQWLDRSGAPKLSLHQAKLTLKKDQKVQVSFEIHQTSPKNYELNVPLRFTWADGKVQSKLVTVKSSIERFTYSLRTAPKSLEIDPEFDVFRELDIKEQSVSLSNIFGSSSIWILGTQESEKLAYQQSWRDSLETSISLSDDKLLNDLPLKGAVLLLGDSPQYEKLMSDQLHGQDFKISPEEITLFGTNYLRSQNQTAIVARSLTHPELIFVWIRGPHIENLAPRLLHYGKYGVLVFSENAVPVKSTWPILTSPLKKEWP
ncbi:MAG: M1 family metallopeptidase, partial [Pseudobdellovibrionaceae bacterium]